MSSKRGKQWVIHERVTVRGLLGLFERNLGVGLEPHRAAGGSTREILFCGCSHDCKPQQSGWFPYIVLLHSDNLDEDGWFLRRTLEVNRNSDLGLRKTSRTGAVGRAGQQRPAPGDAELSVE